MAADQDPGRTGPQEEPDLRMEGSRSRDGKECVASSRELRSAGRLGHFGRDLPRIGQRHDIAAAERAEPPENQLLQKREVNVVRGNKGRFEGRATLELVKQRDGVGGRLSHEALPRRRGPGR